MMANMKALETGLFLLITTAMTAGVLAQTPQPAAAEPAAPTLPVVNPADELKDAALVDALRRGGLVLYMRHALQIPPTSEVCDKSNLTDAGEAQARKVGEAIRALGIPIGAVKSSEPCRSQDTARLLALGTAEITKDLNPVGSPRVFDVHPARFRHLSEVPRTGTNTILVSHVHGSRNKADWMQLEIAEIIVYRPDGKGGTLPIARIRLEGWDDLIKRAAK